MPAQKIVPNLWFDKEAEEAARLYTSLFKNSEILRCRTTPTPDRRSTARSRVR